MKTENVEYKPYSDFAIRPWSRHSFILLIIGFGHIAIGASYLYLETGGPRFRMLVVALNVAPASFWALLFMIIGLFIVLSSIWPKRYDKWGYSIATGLSVGWGAVYIAGAFFQEAYYGANVAMGFIYTMLGFLYWGISGLVNPTDVAFVVVENERD